MTITTALYTTYYPAVDPYLPKWRDSLLSQTDRDVVIVVGLDGESADRVQKLLGPNVSPTFFEAMPGETPITLRSRVLERITAEFEAVIMSDMDDILLPTRISSAKYMLRNSDLNCCAMQVSKDDALVADALFNPCVRREPFRSNVFGLTNTAWRSELLAKCLPVTAEVPIMDWLLATRAWVGSSKLITYDPVPRVVYRQHANSVARIIPPFSAEEVLQASKLVSTHYEVVMKETGHRLLPLTGFLTDARDNVENFISAVTTNDVILFDYVEGLNKLPARHVWWDCVAHPELEGIWKH